MKRLTLMLFSLFVLFGCQSEDETTTNQASSTSAPTVSEGTIIASNLSTSSVTLSWTKATDAETADIDLTYTVYYSTADNISTSSEAETNGSAAGEPATDIDSVSVTGLSAGTTYYFNVVVADSDGSKAAYTSLSQTTNAVDASAPTSASISLASGASTTTTTNLTASLSASDDQAVTAYYLSTSAATPGASASGWVAVAGAASYSGTADVVLSSEQGIQTYYAWFKDAAGNVSSPASDSIVLTGSWTVGLGSTGTDTGRDAAIDSAGNVFVVGSVSGSVNGATHAGSLDLNLAKYNASGTYQWMVQKGSAGDDYFLDVALDSAGNVYAVGGASGSIDSQTYNAGVDGLITKYDTNGNHLWSVMSYGSASGDDLYCALHLDSSDNLFVAGEFNGDVDGQTSNGGSDLLVSKYDTSGTRLWTKLLGGSGNESCINMTLDRSGNIYLVGSTASNWGGTAQLTDGFVSKLDANGNLLWVKQVISSADDVANGIGVDSAGNVYASGGVRAALSGQTYAGGTIDLWFGSWDSSGNERFITQRGTAGDDRAYELKVDSADNFYFIGRVGGDIDGHTFAGGFYDFALMKYDSNGTHQWTKVWGTTGKESAYGLEFDAHNNLYISGEIDGTLDNYTTVGGYDQVFLKNPSDYTP